MDEIKVITTNYSAYEIVMYVHELHQRGYEQLRLMTGFAPSGCYLRWLIYPKALMKDNLFEHYGEHPSFSCLSGSTGMEYPKDRECIPVENFIEGNESFIELARGKDPEYVRWFENVVTHAHKKIFPIAFEEYFNAKQWKFTSGEPLSYPPFDTVSSTTISTISM